MKKLIIIIVTILVLGLVVGLIVYNSFPEYKPKYIVKEIHSNTLNESIYLKKKSWGITYDHEIVVVSTLYDEKSVPDTTNDYIFLDPEIFYKVNHDTLYVYTMSKAKEPNNFNSKIKVNQIELSNTEKMDLIGNDNYKKQGLEMME